MTIINSTELTIDTTANTSVKLGEIIISADRRASKDKKLTDAERIRRITLPANHWGDISVTQSGAKSQGLMDVLTKGLKEIASDRLRDLLTEHPMSRTVLASDYSIASLLAWSADTAATRGSLTFTVEEITEWYPNSKLQAAMSKRGKEFVEFVGKRLTTLAAKNHGLKTPEEADKLIVLLSDDGSADEPAPIVGELMSRLTHISKSLTAKKAETTISLDSL